MWFLFRISNIMMQNYNQIALKVCEEKSNSMYYCNGSRKGSPVPLEVHGKLPEVHGGFMTVFIENSTKKWFNYSTNKCYFLKFANLLGNVIIFFSYGFYFFKGWGHKIFS